LVYRWIDVNVYWKSTNGVTTDMQLRYFRVEKRFSADYHQQYLGKNPEDSGGVLLSESICRLTDHLAFSGDEIAHKSCELKLPVANCTK
jgi:hypothetical protein